MRKHLLAFLLFLFFLPLQNYVVIAQSYKWGNVAIGGGGFVSGIITSKIEKNLMYARTDVGGAYRWNATTGTWIPLLDWTSSDETGYQGVEALAIDPQTPSKLYMLVGTSYFNGGKTAILRSTDYGNTFVITDVTSQFKAHGNGMGRQNGERLAVDPNNGNILFCGTRANGLFKSTNAGANWTNVSSLNVSSTSNGNGINFVIFDPSTGTTGNATQTLFVGVSQTGTNLYMSTNGGTSFTAVTGGPTGLMPQRATLSSDRNLYITYANAEGPWNPNNGQIWKYNVANGAWSNITPSGTTFPYGGISVDPSNPKRLIASTINVYWTQYPNTYGDRFFLSTDGGTSWRDLVGNGITLNSNGCTWIGGQSIHWAGCIEFNPFNTNQAWVISGNGLFSCDDVNATTTTWKFNAIGIEEAVPLDIASITNGPLVSVIGDYDGFKHTDITQFAPIHTPRMGTTTGLAYASLNPNILLRVGNSMYYSTNQGTSWTQCSINGTQGKVAVSANGSVYLHCPSTSSTMYRSTNNGSSWTTCNGISIGDAVPVADPVNTNKFYAYNSSSGAMMVSTDGGANFSNAGSAGTGGSKLIRTVPGLEGHLWVPLNWGGLTRSTNSGASFTKISNVSYCGAVGLGKAAPGASYHTIYIWGTVSGVTGVFRSTDQGATWVRVNDNEHEYGGPGNGQFVIGDMNVYGRVYMSTVGRGIAYGDPQTTVNQSPSVSIASPGNNTSFCQGNTITLTATASDADGTVSKVEIYDGTTLLTTLTTSPYTYSWTPAGAGTHSVTAKATDNGGATATSAAVSVTVNAIPAAPGVSPVTYCQNATATGLTANGTGLKWYTASTGGTSSTTAPVPSTSIAGTNNYYVSQTVNGCESSRATIGVTVNATPAAPGVTSPVTYCQNATATALTANGTGLKWYTVSTGGTSSTTAPAPSTSTAGTNNYYVSQTVNGCESARSTIAVTVNAIPAAPGVVSPVTYCQNAAATALTANGTVLQWYTASTGGTSATTAPVPSTTTAGTNNYYVSQTVNGCESPRATIAVTVNATPAAPGVTSPVTYCQNAAATALTANGTVLQWYTASTGSTSSTTAPVPSTTTAGTNNYYVSQTVNGCESPRATIGVTVNATPAAPGVTSPVTYCQNAAATALTANGTGLQWYTASTGGTSSTTAPVPSTTTAGTNNYYVSQTVNGCESARSTIAVTVNAIPATPGVVSPVTYCQNETATALTGNGTGLQWYTASTGGTSATTAPVPSTSTAGNTNYYVSQTVNGCESSRAMIKVTVNSVPLATITSTSSTTFCAGGSVGLNASTGSGYTYVWKKDGTVLNGANTSNYNATSSGSYIVTITANGCSSTTAPVTVTVNTPPAATITPSGSTTFCEGGSVTLNGTSGAGLTYVWKNNGTVLNGATTASYTVTSSGSYSVTVTGNGCSATSASITVTVDLPPAPSNAGPDQYLTTTTAVLSGSSPAPGQGLWTLAGGSGTIQNATNPQATVSGLAMGDNRFVWTVKNGSCASSSDEVVIHVSSAPVSQVINGPSNVAVNTKATYSVPDDPNSSYTWSVPSGATIVSGQGTNSITVEFGVGGGDISVVQTNQYGSAASTKTVTAGNAPVATNISGPDSIGYHSTGIVFSVPNHTGSTYQWTVPQGATIVSGQGTSSITVDFATSGGSGMVEVTESNSFGSATSQKNIITGPAPSLNSISGATEVKAGETYTFSVLSDGNPNTNYHWTVPDGAVIVSGQGTNTISVIFPEGNTSGNIGVTVSNGFGTDSVSTGVTVSGTTGIFTHASASYFIQAIPNPFYEELSLAYNAPFTEKIRLRVVDMKGEVVYETENYESGDIISLRENIPAGIYMVIAVTESGVQTVKVEKY